MSFFYSYKQKEGSLPEDLKIKNANKLFETLLSKYKERLS